jgi:hypothetical protein
LGSTNFCVGLNRANAFKYHNFLLSWFLVKTHAKRKKSFLNLRSAKALRYKHVTPRGWKNAKFVCAVGLKYSHTSTRSYFSLNSGEL